MVEGFGIVAIVVALFVIITVLMGVRQVPQGYSYTVERFGRYNKTLTPGLGLVIPYIDCVGRKLNMMEQVFDVPSQEIITKDNATVTVNGVAFYQVLDVRRASYEVANLQLALLNLVMTNTRTVMGSMDLDQLLSHRDEINVRLLSVVDAAALPWGVKVTRIEIKDIEPPRDLVMAMARQMKAEREKRAVILEAEGMRQADITRAEGRKAAVVLEAEGRKEAAFRDAEARERSAQAEAAATRMVSEAMVQGDVAALNYLVADKYVRALQAFAQAPNQKVMIVPMELSSLAGTVAGISQIAAGALGESRAAEAARLGEKQRRAGYAASVVAARPPSAAGIAMDAFGAIASHVYAIWLVVGLALCAAETLAPGAFLIFIGAAAVGVGLVEFVFPLALTPQLMLFAALVVAFVLIGRDLYGSADAGTPPLPLSRAHAMIGQTYVLNEPIQHGFGSIRVGDSVWRVAGDDLAAGAKVRVVSVEDGSLVRVDRV